ncbi:peptidase domain-containing ABC transporter [Mucilaginibacter sp. SMC90]|uniref:peptidase domain-containing ABC transporter n=1 Tax=Mucilaginibacter sp. SMC90 TaxID=2929803 RepID=UPI001FB4C1EA|nr:peptidase domain-containing ABC transporter [Mucilaginibacter sp. SMC90]UOE48667.1 peptidase domain-containing ABC transporter [Mucilaginibacter sp. SMC90]
MAEKFSFFKQHDQMDCGPTCLRMIAKHYGRTIQLQELRNLCQISRSGVSLLGVSEAAEKIGFRTLGVKLTFEQLNDIELPAILHWRQNHFVILYRIQRETYWIADPGVGLIKLTGADVKENWISDPNTLEGIALLLSPSPQFYEQEDRDQHAVSWSSLFLYLIGYRKLIFQLLLGLALASLLQLIVPFLTQSIVDIGVNTRNLNFIQVILLAQIFLIVGRVSVEFIRSWILLHISTRVNISILTDFLIKLMKLPISFFDTKMTGDIMQRMNDQKKIESFLTGSALTTLFSLVNLLLFSFVLIYYKISIFSVFALASALYIAWITAFLGRRRLLNYKSFEVASKNQSNVVQLVNGMQEIKLNNCEQAKRWEWEHLQARLFKFNVKSLALSQYQQGGATLINESKNLLITFLTAKAVINGSLSLGAMVAIQYIVGQLNSPVDQLLGFIQGFQDARISLERLNEIHQLSDEEPIDRALNNELPENKSLSINDLTFCYPSAGNEPVLKNINLIIPEGKTTAIVGTSGSGKTTLLKLLLRFYEPQRGEILIGNLQLNQIAFKSWRSSCGVVMQDGFIFSDTIERNIAVGDQYPDYDKLKHALKIANISDFIDSLPLRLNTKIGAEGNGISQGQRQRILIARAVYKDPHYLFFDEATNALDANNERIITNNLKEFFEKRTVVIVAHRLSTVRDADNIIFMDKGKVLEQGTHDELTLMKGHYFNLVKNQLELGV